METSEQCRSKPKFTSDEAPLVVSGRVRFAVALTINCWRENEFSFINVSEIVSVNLPKFTTKTFDSFLQFVNAGIAIPVATESSGNVRVKIP
ncbi:hypothetical protein MESS4_160003 [Mesorhizobium sp. STM 4661]|nr:hypothetical protein MESS4_160003 [Mesorhizobium sp. STM 4661]